MRGRALNQLLHGTPSVSKQIKADTKPRTTSAAQPETTGAKLPMYFVNAIINEETGEVNMPAIVDCDTGEINAVIDPITGEQKSFCHLISDKKTQKNWNPAMSAEVDRLVGTGTIHFIPRSKIPQGKKVVYLKIVVDIRDHKTVKERVRIVVGGDQSDFQGETTTRTVDVTTVKIHLQSVLSTVGGKYMGLDIKDFYLATPMKKYEYARIKAEYIPKETMDKYQLWDLVDNRYLYIEIRKGMYGLPQSGRLVNNYLKEQLDPFGFKECEHTPGLWRHETRPIVFTLWVDDFGVQYSNKDDVDFLLYALKECNYVYTTDWKGRQYCGITI